MAEVEVTGLSDEVDTEHLTLYFENKRISGGGPLLSCTRDRTEATLTFQNLTDAERVLSKSEHRVSAVILHVRRPAPWDPGKVALCGLNLNTSDFLLEIYVENVSEREKFCTQRSTDGTTALVIFQEPLSETDVESMTQRVSARKLNEATISVKRVRVPCELLVENLVPQISAELLELYLESKRGGGGRVHSVTMLTGRPAAVVSFHDWQVVRDVLNKEHCLLDSQLKFSLYYPKLLGLPITHGSETQEQENFQEMRQNCTTHRSVQLKEQSTDRGEQSNSQEQLSRTERSPRQQSTVDRLMSAVSRQQNTDRQQSKDKQICEVERPPRAKIRQPSAADSQHNERLHTDGHQCSVQLQDEISVHVGAFKTEDRSVPIIGNAEQVDTEVSMQPAQLRFLQERHHELLAGMDEVTIVPLEHDDKTGFMVSGTAPVCQSVTEILHTLVSSLSTSSVMLEYPGISRFLLEPDGQQILQAIESQYNCVIDTSQLSLKALDSEYVDPWSFVPDVLPTKIMTDESPPQEKLLQLADMEDIRVLASLLQNTSSVDNSMTWQSSEEEPQLQSSSIGLNISPEDTELDIYSESTSCVKDNEENVVDEELEKAFAMSRVEFQERELDEEAELLLAIQRSMDVRQLSTQEEDEAIKRALEMSLREQVLEETEESLQIALKRSLAAKRADGEMVEDQGSILEEIEQALGTAQLIVVAEEKNELIAACMALRKAVKGKLCTESVEAMLDLHIQHSGILSALQRKHRVSITVSNRHIVIEGFSSSPSNCHQELLEIISFLQERNSRAEDQDVQQLPYHVTYKRPRTSDNVQIGVEFVSVAEDSEEFASIVNPFYNTLEELKNCIQILEVQRVHNTLLDNQYELKKRSVGASDTRKPVERVLYHGTTESSAMEICHHGFNRSFCGKNASLYGQGVYFAVKAVLSARDNYSPPTDVGKKYVLVAKVLTGNFTVGKADMRAPPSLPDSTGAALRRYDSLVDSHHNPSIFVIFNDTQACPHYLITCRRQDDSAAHLP